MVTLRATLVHPIRVSMEPNEARVASFPASPLGVNQAKWSQMSPKFEKMRTAGGSACDDARHVGGVVVDGVRVEGYAEAGRMRHGDVASDGDERLDEQIALQPRACAQVRGRCFAERCGEVQSRRDAYAGLQRRRYGGPEPVLRGVCHDGLRVPDASGPRGFDDEHVRSVGLYDLLGVGERTDGLVGCDGNLAQSAYAGKPAEILGDHGLLYELEAVGPQLLDRVEGALGSPALIGVGA